MRTLDRWAAMIGRLPVPAATREGSRFIVRSRVQTITPKKAAEYLELAQRTQADFENFRKRAVKDMAAAGARAKAGLIRELLPVVDNHGETRVPGVFVAGRVLGASTAEEAARQGRIAGAAASGAPVEGVIEPPRAEDPVMPERLDPLSLAELLEQPPGPERNRAALAQALARGPLLSATIAPARPVGFAALAALAPAAMPDRDLQQDSGRLA